MAYAATVPASGGNKTPGGKASDTTATLSATTATDDLLVVLVAADNAGTNGVSAFSSVALNVAGAVDSWDYTPVNRTAGSANDGTTLVMAVGKITTGSTTSSTITINYSPNIISSAWVFLKITGGAPKAVNVF